MNKQRYRIVFNRTRGALMAVAESAGSQAGGARASSTPRGLASSLARSLAPVLRLIHTPGLLALALLAGGTVGLQPYAHAQIVADRTAPGNLQPQVTTAANGVPLVNIQTPGSAGVSRNVYSQFDVSPRGVILNNATSHTQSQLGGWVQANPNLAGGAARVILNEVNASNPSILRGYLEVAGSRAQVVVANPAGITCDGCGFINAERATLTTGTPIINSGSLDGYRVTGGQILIQGNGLDASSTDYTDLIARSIQVNAGIWANQLRVTTGANQTDAANTVATPIAGSSPAPAFAIDVAQLGGMYAGKIHLIGTEAGIGMRNAGGMGASAGEVRITIDGQLINTGTLSASQNLALNTRGIDNAGTLAAQTDIQLTSQGKLANRGLIQAGRELQADISADITNAGSILAQRLDITADTLDNTGTLRQTGSQGMHIEAQSLGNASAATLGHRIPDPITPGTPGSTSSGTTGSTPAPSTAGDGSSLASTTPPQWILADGRLVMRGQLQNRGSLTANGLTTLKTGDLDNTGTLNVDQLTASGTHFNNLGGTVSVTNLDIRSQDIDNTRGTIHVAGQLKLAASKLDNTTGTLQHTGNTDASLSLQDQLINTDGRIASTADKLTLTATQLDNTRGTIVHLGSQKLSLTADRIDSSDGTLYSLKQIIARASDIKLDNAKLSADQLDLAADTLSTRSAQVILSGAQANTLIARTSLDNTGGILASSAALDLSAGALDNTGGHIQSDTRLSLALTQDFTNTGTLLAGERLDLGLAGKLTNRNLITAGDTLSIQAREIDNQSGAEISAATTRISASGTLNNRGLIDGGTTRLDAATLNNIGSGRIYGDHLAIAAGTLNNLNESGASPTIAARQRLDLGIGNLYNDNAALIFSAGNLAIGGTLDTNHQASGRAGSIVNNGGTLQALGALAIAARSLHNGNPNFSAIGEPAGAAVSRTVYVTSQGTLTDSQIAARYDAGVWGNLLDGNPSPNPAANSGIAFLLNPTPSDPVAVNTGPLTVYSYLTESYQPLTARVISSTPGQILSGSDMRLDCLDSLTNDKSRIIAGGALQLAAAGINNIAADVSGTEYHSGTSYNWGYAGHSGRSTGYRCGCDFYAFKPSPYATSVNVTVTAPIAVVQSGQGGTAGQALPNRNASGASPLSSGATPGSNQSVPVNLTVPAASLYHLNPAPGGRYLIETDPRFANYRNWLSSDYMQSRLALDPSVTQKRLGDGYYEQQLIRDQIAQLTGRRFLDGYSNDEAQYQALMDAAITQAKAFNLRPGIALSAAQLAQLTSDIVWLVEQDVTLTDGSTQKALVPQVYLLPHTGDLKADGTLIAGQSISIKAAGEVFNSGRIAGRELLKITADNITNQGGVLDGKDVDLNATKDILNRGGVIQASDRLALAAGRDITLQSTTATGSGETGSETSGGRFSQTRLDRIAGLYVTGSAGTLSAVAGRDLTLTAAEVVNAGSGSTTLAAGNNLILDTVTTADQIDIGGNSRNHARVSTRTEVGSKIRSQGDLTLLAGNDIAGRAVDIQGQGKVTLAAGNDLTLAAGRNEQSVDIASYATGKSGGGFKQRSVTRELQINAQTDTAITGTVTGQNITLQSGRDLTLEGGAYRATETLSLDAGRDLTLAAGESSASQQQKLQVSSKETRGFGSQSLKTTRSETTVTPDVAQLAGQDIQLSAGRDMTLVAPQIKAQTLSASAAGALTVAAATATHELKESSEFKSNRFNFSEVTNPRITGGRIKDKIKLGESSSQRTAVVAQIAARDIVLNSGNDTTLVAPQIQAERLSITAGEINGQTVNPDAKIQLLGVKESSSTSSSKNSHSFLHETVRDGGQSTETLRLPKIELASPVNPENPQKSTVLTLKAPGGIVVGATSLAPTRQEQKQAGSSSGSGSSGGFTAVDLKAQAQTLAQQPGLAWLGEVAQRQDVDWQKIELATQQWDYKRAGLTQEGAVVVTIVVTVLTAGWASAAGGAVGGATTTATGSAAVGAAAGAATAAAVSTLAAQAAVSLINNQGDVGKTLEDLGSKENIKQLVASMLTAGVTQGISGYLPNPANAGFAERFVTYAARAAVSAGVQSVVYGTPLSETAQTALVNSLAQSLTSQIGNWGKGGEVMVAKALAHAVVQCAAASIQSKDCGSAALGAAVAEAISPQLDALDDRTRAAGFQQTLGSSIAGMGAMLVASLTGKDPITALNAAQMVDNFNRALHLQENNALKAAAKKLAAAAVAGREATQEQQQQLENYWFDQLESEAKAKVGATAAGIRKTYLDNVATSTQPGYIGGANQYLADAQIARDVVAGLSGAVLYGTDGKPIIADGSELRAFQASNAQYNDSQLLLSNTTSTLIKQFGSLEAANNAQAMQSRRDNLILAGVRNDRESALLNAYRQPSEGVQTSVPEAYLIGTGGLAKSLVSAAVDAGKAGLGAVGRAGLASEINSGTSTIAATTKLITQYGPMAEQGPLPQSIANTFRSGTYAETVVMEPTTLYRVYGGTANQLGGYWTSTPPTGPVQSIIDSALNPAWGNPATNVVKIEVPAGVRLYQGQAANQGGLVGGGNQVLFPKDVAINPKWIIR